MEFNFNKIKALIQEDKNQPLPSELDWDNMKDGIFNTIESIEQEEFPQTKNKAAKRALWFILLLFVLLVGLFSAMKIRTTNQVNYATDTEQFSETDSYNRSVDKVSEAAHSMNQIQSFTETFDNNKEKIKDNGLLSTVHKSDNNQESKSTKKDNTKGDDTMLEERKIYKNLNENILTNPFNDSIDFGAKPSIIDTNQNTLNSIAEVSNLNLAWQVSVPENLPTLGITPVDYEKINYSELDFPLLDSKYDPNQNQEKLRHLLILDGGLTFWKEGYGSNKPQRAEHETPIPSYQLQAHFRKNLKKDYFIMAGLQYQQLESRFRYNTIIEDYNVTLTDVIVQVHRNSFTGEEYAVRGDLEQNVRAERRIRHYNKTQLVKVSLAAGKTWRFNSFQTDVYFGGALNGLVQNKGRLLDGDTVIDYDGKSNSVFQNQWAIDGVFGVRLHYFLSEKFGLNTSLQTQKSLTNWTNQDNINYHPLSFSLNLGFSYFLK